MKKYSIYLQVKTLDEVITVPADSFIDLEENCLSRVTQIMRNIWNAIPVSNDIFVDPDGDKLKISRNMFNPTIIVVEPTI